MVARARDLSWRLIARVDSTGPVSVCAHASVAADESPPPAAVRRPERTIHSRDGHAGTILIRVRVVKDSQALSQRPASAAVGRRVRDYRMKHTTGVAGIERSCCPVALQA